MTPLFDRRDAIRFFAGTAFMQAAQPCRPLTDWLWGPDCHSVNVPMALTPGTTRTPDFPVRSEHYLILLRFLSDLPFKQAECLVGGIPGVDHCVDQSLLKGTWRVLDGTHAAAEGEIEGGIYSGGGGYNEALLGKFEGQNHKRWSVEVTLTRDATALKVPDPRLVIHRPYGM